MKKFSLFLFFALIITRSFNVYAAWESWELYTVGDLRYHLNADTRTASVYSSVNSLKIIIDLVIPDFIEYEGEQVPVTLIEGNAFNNNKNLRGSLTIGNNVQTIGNSAFWGCSGLSGSLTIGENVQTIRDGAFQGCGFTGSLTIPNSVLSIGTYAFLYCKDFNGSLTIGNNVQTIGKEAFFCCEGFTGSLTIPDNVHTIGESAFLQCSGFNGSLTIGDKVQVIDAEAFRECKGFTGHLTIPDNVQTIGDRAFSSCSGFNGSLTIGNNVQTIGKSAFMNCKFSEVKSYAITPAEAEDYAFDNFYSSPLYVPSVSVNLYKTADEWKKFYYINPIPVEATDISINKKELTLLVGQEETLIATLTPEDATTEIVWSVDEMGNNIISVDQNGKVTGLGVGTATVTATAEKLSVTCKVTVKGSNDVTIKPGTPGMEGTDLTLRINQTEKITLDFPADLSVTPIFQWELDEDGDKYVRLSPADDTFSADFTGLAFGKTGYTVKIQGSNEILVSGNITVIAEMPMTSLILEPAAISMAQNALPQTLTPRYTPEGATMPQFSWTCSDPTIATVDDNGVVSPVAMGKATITCSALDGSGLSATCEVTVTAPVDEDFEFEFDESVMGGKEGISIYIGDTYQFVPKAKDGYVLPDIINWTSSDDKTVSVNNEGLITALALGKATITASATVNGKEVSATCKVTVIPVLANKITLSAQDMTLLVGQTDKLTATIEPENVTDKTLTWKSDNEAVATVSADGTVTAVSVGTANITATCGEAAASCKVTVNPVEATSIELSLQDVTILVGSTATITAKVYPENATVQTITWSSNDPSIATVDAEGTITALQVGETTVTATCGNVSATCKVTVTPVSPSSIELNIKDMVLFIGQSETIQAIVRPANTTYPTVTWYSEDESIATVAADGKVTGVNEGVTTITASCGDVSATCKVTVNPIPASNIEITTGDVTLTIGSNATLVAKVSPDNTTHPDVDWSSSDTGIATITADGTVTAVSVGTAIITAKCGNVSATCTVTVIPVPSEGIVISPTSVSMLLGEEVILSATVFPENTTDKTVTWGSDNPSVASVSSTGVVTALSLGTATITASNGTSKATCEVTVNPVVATSISLNVKDETIFVASTTQLVATISPANVTDKTITWTSSKPEIATVSDQGLVYGVAVGTTTVTATIGSVSASCQINVVHRIPDMDPSVSTSNRDIVTLSGKPVNMAVYPEGGEPTGWSYTWTKNGEVVSQSTELNITAVNNSQTVIAEIYRVKVENEIDKVVILSEIFDFVVQIYPNVDENRDDIDINVSTGNGSSKKIREGNTVNLSVNTPNGGYPQGWEYLWRDAQGKIGDEATVNVVASMSSGNGMAVEEATYNLKLTNYGPEGDVWALFNLETSIDVYRRPQTPVQMLRKGNGTSHTFIAMMPLMDSQLQQLNYNFVYGWTDSDGKDHIIDVTDMRYCHADEAVYNNSSNKFWVYSFWNYPDGSVVTSGLCSLDGSIDESFDASSFDGTGPYKPTGTSSRKAVYSIDGQYIGDSTSNLLPGMYIVVSENNGVKSSQKIVIR